MRGSAKRCSPASPASGRPQSAAVAAPYLRSDDAEVRTGALDALRAMPQAARPELPALLEDHDPDVRLLACEIVRALPGPDALRLLGALLERESDANVCAAAVDVVAEIGDATILPTLARCAERFSGEPFLVFAVKVASDRIATARRRPTWLSPRRCPRRNSAASASSCIGAPA